MPSQLLILLLLLHAFVHRGGEGATAELGIELPLELGFLLIIDVFVLLCVANSYNSLRQDVNEALAISVRFNSRQFLAVLT